MSDVQIKVDNPTIPKGTSQGRKPKGSKKGKGKSRGQKRESLDIEVRNQGRPEQGGSKPKRQKTISSGSAAEKVARKFESAISKKIAPQREGILSMLTDPKDNPFGVVRYDSQFTKGSTAVASPFVVDSIGFNSGTTTLQMPDSDMIIAAFRCAERGYVIYDANIGVGIVAYDFLGASVQSEFANIPPAVSWAITLPSTDFQYLFTPCAIPAASATFSAHGAVWFAGSVTGTTEGGRFFWLDEGTTLTAVATNNTGSTADFTLSLDLWTDEGMTLDAIASVDTAVLDGANATLPIVITVSGYYCMKIASSEAGAVDIVNIVSSTTDDVFCHRCIPGFEVMGGAVAGVRVLAVSAMFSNRAAPLNRQGSVVGFQSPPGKSWTDYVGDYASLANSPDSSEMEASNGIYGFLLPSQPEDLALQTYSKWQDGVLMDSHYPLGGSGSFLIIYITIAEPDGRSGKYTIAYALEFATNNNWFPTHRPSVSTGEWEMTLDKLKDIKQWYENPIHWKQLWGKIKSTAGKVFKGIENYGPKVLETAQTLGSLFG